MKIKILFFGILTDITQTSSLELSGIKDLNTLKSTLWGKYPEMKTLKFQIAVNGNIVSDNTTLKDGDEIAFLPPFAGG